MEFDGSLNAALKRLRFALGDSAENPIFIETLPKRGYRFVAPVSVEESVGNASWLPQNKGDETHAAKDEDSAQDAAPFLTIQSKMAHWRQRSLFGFALALLVAAGVASYHRLISADESKRVRVSQPPSVRPRVSVAVIGFNNASGRPEDAWLSTAFSEMLSTELSAGGKLRLVSGEDVANLRLSSPWSRTDTLARETTARIGTALNSDLLVLGSYTNLGRPERGQLRLDVRLQEAGTGEILAEVAEIGSSQDFFQLISQIGGKLRNRLDVPGVADTDRPAVLASLPSNSEATRLYSLGLVKSRE